MQIVIAPNGMINIILSDAELLRQADASAEFIAKKSFGPHYPFSGMKWDKIGWNISKLNP